MAEVQRLVAFSSDPRGGNPAGVVLDDKRLWLLGNPGMAAALKRLNNSKSRTVSDSSWDSIPRGGSLG